MDRQHVTCGAEVAGHHRNKGIQHLTVRPRSDLQDRTTWNKASRDQQKESNQRIMYMHVHTRKIPLMIAYVSKIR